MSRINDTLYLFSGGDFVKWMSKKNKKSILVLIVLVLLIAGFLDIKYEGLFFRLLPNSIQSYLTDLF